MDKVALCYVRKSYVRLGTSDELSPARQRANVVREAEARSLIPEVYEDAEGNRSGRTEKRPGWQALKAQLDRPEVAAVIVESLSRASRSVADLFSFIKRLEERRIALISLKEQFNTSTTMGRMAVGVIALLNQFESDIASERTRTGIDFIRKGKHRHWGMVPYGCERDGQMNLRPTREGVWWLNGYQVVGQKDQPPCAGGVEAVWRGYHDALGRCFEIYSQNSVGYLKIDDMLNAEGFRCRSRWHMPRPFNHDDIRRLIAGHRIYAGYVVIGRPRLKGWKAIEGGHQPILPVELCDKVAEVLRLRNGRWATGFGGKPKHDYLLRAHYCARCGARLTGIFQKGERWYRHEDKAIECDSKKRSYRAELIEAQVWTAIQQFQPSEQTKQKIRTHALRQARAADQSEVRRVERELQQLRLGLDRLNDLYINEGRLTKPEYAARRARLDAEINEAETRINRALPDVRKLDRALKRLDEIVALIRQGNPTQRRESIDALVKRIESFDGKVVKIETREWAQPIAQPVIDDLSGEWKNSHVARGEFESPFLP